MKLKMKYKWILLAAATAVFLFLIIWTFTCPETICYMVPGESMETAYILNTTTTVEIGDHKITAGNKGDAYLLGWENGFVRYTVHIVDPELEQAPQSMVLGESFRLEEKDGLSYEYSYDKELFSHKGNTFTAERDGSSQFSVKVNGVLQYDETITVQKMRLSDKSIEMYADETMPLELKDTAEGLKWESSDPEIAEWEDGQVIAHKAGTCSISASAGKETVSCKVKVYDIPAAKTLMKITMGEKETLSVANLIDDVKWKLKKTDTVKLQGDQITALKPGKAEVTGTSHNHTVTVVVNVPEPTATVDSLNAMHTVTAKLEGCPENATYEIEDPSIAMLGNANDDAVQAALSDAHTQELLSQAKQITDYVRENGFVYADAPLNPAIYPEVGIVSCDRFVGWVLYNMGYTDQPDERGLTLFDLWDFCVSHGFTYIDNLDDCQAGDIIFQGVDTLEHTYILGEYEDGLWQRYDCGNQVRIDSEQPMIQEKCDAFYGAFRVPFVSYPYLVEAHKNQLLITGISEGTTNLIIRVGDYKVKVPITVGSD